MGPSRPQDDRVDRGAGSRYKVRVLSPNGLTERHANYQSAGAEGPRSGAEEIEDARDAGVSPEAGRLHPRVHDDAEEAELRPPEGRARSADEWPRGDVVHPRRRS